MLNHLSINDNVFFFIIQCLKVNNLCLINIVIMLITLNMKLVK